MSAPPPPTQPEQVAKLASLTTKPTIASFSQTVLPTIDTFVFDIDSTVFTIELLDAFAQFCAVDVVAITNRAMNGEISFAKALVERIERIQLPPENYYSVISAFLTQTRSTIAFTPSCVELLTLLYEHNYNVYFISGGFKIFIVDLLQWLLPTHLAAKINFATDVHANHFLLPYNPIVDIIDPNHFNIDLYLKGCEEAGLKKSEEGQSHSLPDSIVSVDTTLFTAQTNGKARVLDLLRAQGQGQQQEEECKPSLQQQEEEEEEDKNTNSKKTKSNKIVDRIIMIGDGVTDLQAKPPAIGVIGYGGVIARPIVVEKSDWFIYDYQELIAGIKMLKGDPKNK